MNDLVRLFKWHELDLRLIEMQFHSVNKINNYILCLCCDKQLNLSVRKPIASKENCLTVWAKQTIIIEKHMSNLSK